MPYAGYDVQLRGYDVNFFAQWVRARGIDSIFNLGALIAASPAEGVETRGGRRGH